VGVYPYAKTIGHVFVFLLTSGKFTTDLRLRMKYLVFLLAISHLLIPSAFASKQSLIGGVPTDNYSGIVFALLGPAKCTATKIGARTYLTAAHCLTSRTPDENGTIKRYLNTGDPIFMSAEPEVRNYGDLFFATIDKIYIHPSYDFFQTKYANGELDDFTAVSRSLDLAIFKIESSIPGILARQISYEKVKINQYFFMLGYGCEDRFKSDQKQTEFLGRKKVGFKYAGTVEGDASLIFLDQEIRSDLDRNYIYSEGIMTYDPRSSICSGDPGGPVLVNDEVAGVISFAYADDEGQAYNNFFTRLHTTKTWIANVLAE